MGTRYSLRRSLLGIAAVAAIFNVIGCGAAVEGDKFKGERGSVTGTIVFGGKAVPANTQVLFQSKEGSYAAAGKTNDKGEYTLSYSGKPNMPAVAYKIQLTPPPAAAVDTSDPSKMVGSTPTEVPAGPFPAKYSSTATSGLERTVKAGAQKFDIDLTE